MRTKSLSLLVLPSLLLLGTACSSAGSTEASGASANEPAVNDQLDEDEHSAEDMNEGDHDDSMDHMHVEAPHEFASLENPFAADHEAVEAGRRHSTHCASLATGSKGRETALVRPNKNPNLLI